MLYSDAPVTELALELLLLQVVLSELLEQGRKRQWLKGLGRACTVTAGYSLDLHSYLLEVQEENENSANQQVYSNQHAWNHNAIPVMEEVLHAAHQAILQQEGPAGFQSYHQPLNFPLRIFLFVKVKGVCFFFFVVKVMCIILLTASLICLTLLEFASCWLMSFWRGNIQIHERYTAACGRYACWPTIRAVNVLAAGMPRRRRVVFRSFRMVPHYLSLPKVKLWPYFLTKIMLKSSIFRFQICSTKFSLVF